MLLSTQCMILCQRRRSLKIFGGPGLRPPLCPSFNPPFFPSLLWTPKGRGLMSRDRSPAAKYFEAIYTFKQFILFIVLKSTLMFNVLYRNQRVCWVQPLSAELILWITGHSMALKVGVGARGGPCIHVFGPPLPESGEGVRTPGPPKDRRHWFYDFWQLSKWIGLWQF